MCAYRPLFVAIAAMLVSCVDNSFRIDEVSKEVTLGGDSRMTLPLGSLKERTIGELLEDMDIPGLEIDSLGNFKYSYDGQSGSMAIEGVTSLFEIPEIQSSFDVDYPEFGLDMEAIVIEDEEDIDAIYGLEGYPTSGRIPQGVVTPNIECEYTHVIDSDRLHLALDLPEQIKGVNKVLFRDVESGHHGAPMHISVALNGLKDINAGGDLEFDLSIEGGRFTILDAHNNPICDGDHYAANYHIDPGIESVDFVIYIESITNISEIDSSHHLDIPIKMTYDMALDISTKAGYFDLNDKPHIALTADFEYGDADVVVDGGVNLVECKASGGDLIRINGMPEELKRVNSVAIVQDDSAILDLYAHGMEWLGDLAEDVEVEVALPDYLNLHSVEGEGYIYDETTGVLTASIAQLDRGVRVDIEALDFGAEGVAPNEDGSIELLFEPQIVARFKDGSHVSISQLKHDEPLSVVVGVGSSELSVESLTGRVDYTYVVDETFALEGLDGVNLKVEGAGIKPVIEVDLTNPLTVEAILSGVITPSCCGELSSDVAVTFGDVVLPPATYVDNEVRPTATTIVIGDESLREQYSDAKYTFVACDVASLLVGRLPDAMNISMQFGIDPTREQTLHITEDLTLTYDYRIEIPMAIDSSLRLSYNDEVAGLNSLFSELADYDITIGDVVVLAKVSNTTPLEFGLSMRFKDVEGYETEAQLRIPESDRILGSSDGVTPQESVVHIVLDLGESGELSKLCDIDAIEFELVASSAAKESAVALNSDQSVGVELMLQVDGGITLDVDQLLNM